MEQATPTSERDEVVAFLQERDVPCPLCGYNLRNLREPRCPECGAGVRLTVGLVDLYLRAWLTGAVSLCASAGAGVFLGLIVLGGGGFPRFPNIMAAVDFFSFPCMIPFAILFLMSRRKFLRLTRSSQKAWAIFLVAIVVVQFVAIPTWLR